MLIILSIRHHIVRLVTQSWYQ